MIVNSLDKESILSELSSLKDDLTTRYEVKKNWYLRLDRKK